MVNEITVYVCDHCGTVDSGKFNPKTEKVECEKCWQCGRKMIEATFIRREIALFQESPSAAKKGGER